MGRNKYLWRNSGPVLTCVIATCFISTHAQTPSLSCYKCPSKFARGPCVDVDVQDKEQLEFFDTSVVTCDISSVCLHRRGARACGGINDRMDNCPEDWYCCNTTLCNAKKYTRTPFRCFACEGKECPGFSFKADVWSNDTRVEDCPVGVSVCKTGKNSRGCGSVDETMDTCAWEVGNCCDYSRCNLGFYSPPPPPVSCYSCQEGVDGADKCSGFEPGKPPQGTTLVKCNRNVSTCTATPTSRGCGKQHVDLADCINTCSETNCNIAPYMSPDTTTQRPGGGDAGCHRAEAPPPEECECNCAEGFVELGCQTCQPCYCSMDDAVMSSYTPALMLAALLARYLH